MIAKFLKVLVNADITLKTGKPASEVYTVFERYDKEALEKVEQPEGSELPPEELLMTSVINTVKLQIATEYAGEWKEYKLEFQCSWEEHTV